VLARAGGRLRTGARWSERDSSPAPEGGLGARARRPFAWVLAALAPVLLVPAAGAGAAQAAPTPTREVEVPVTLDYGVLEQALLAEVYTEAGGTARLLDDGAGCNRLLLADPRVDGVAGRVRIRTRAEVRAGTPLGERCLSVLDWTGTIEILEVPSVVPGSATVAFTVVDSRLLDAEGRPIAVVSWVWDRVKRYVHPRIEAVTIDLAPALAELRALLPLVLAGREAEAHARLLDSLAVAEAAAAPEGLAPRFRFELPDLPLERQPPREPPLTADELAAFERELERWDAFLTYVLKQIAGEEAAKPDRLALREVLLESRFDLVEALTARDAAASQAVRALFVRAWSRLAPLVRALASGLPAPSALRLASFVAAGDALAAIEALGPASGLDLSADGLRRLARVLAPADARDPLDYDLAVDAELRALLGFGPPLPPPAQARRSGVGSWLMRAARASAGIDMELVERLNGWVPGRDELVPYLELVAELLTHTALSEVEAAQLAAHLDALYRPLVLATAWQESCWRQFVKRGQRIEPIRSPAGAVGIMQVNQRVWRGFYDVEGLQDDIAYNARAGAEILRHYLVDYAVARGEHDREGGIENLPRATYAAYNGGPGHLARYREARTSERLRRIDRAFWEKYRTVREGDPLAVASCFG